MIQKGSSKDENHPLARAQGSLNSPLGDSYKDSPKKERERTDSSACHFLLQVRIGLLRDYCLS